MMTILAYLSLHHLSGGALMKLKKVLNNLENDFFSSSDRRNFKFLNNLLEDKKLIDH
jgi:hypothetical protein